MVHFKINFIFIVALMFHGLTNIIAADNDEDTDGYDYPVQPESNNSTCTIGSGNPEELGDILGLVCMNIGVDNRSLDQVLKDEPLLYPTSAFIGDEKRYPLEKIANRVATIDISASATLNIKKGTFSNLPTLEKLSLFSFVGQGEFATQNLSISKDELASIPYLRDLSIRNFALSDDAIQAVAAIKDRADSLAIWSLTPARAVLDLLSQFTNLTILEVNNVRDENPFPMTAFQKSAGKLNWISIQKANIPKIKKDLLRGLVNLTNLSIVESDVAEIEPGAFDDLQNLKVIDLTDNKLKSLPQGLFDKNNNLESVMLYYNENITNIAISNFTNHKHLKEVVVQLDDEIALS